MSVRLTVKLKGAKLARQGLEQLRAEVPIIGRQRFFNALTLAKKKITHYPPPRAGQRYKRTGIYGRGWHIERHANGYRLHGQARQRGRDYTKYVGGGARGGAQAWMHKKRWTLMRDAVAEQVSALPKLMREHVTMIARKINHGR